jgi:hypothetical protein
MKISKKMMLLSSTIMIASLVFACGEPIPIKELSLAKNQISADKTVNAAKYAPEEFKAAEAALYAAHDMVKKEKFDDAKSDAEKSKKKGEEAYHKSVPLLAKDTMDIADQSIASALETHADVLAKEKFDSIKDLNLKNKEKYENAKT